MALSTLRFATVAVIGALVALILYAGEPKELSWWLLAIPFSAWIIGPAIMPYVTARRFADRQWFVWTMLTFLTLSSAWAANAYYHAFFIATSSTAALVVLFVPLYQWMALGCVGLVCARVILYVDRRNNRLDA